MKTITNLVLCACFIAFAGSAFAQSGTYQRDLVSEMTGQVDFVKGRVLQLEEAVPDADFTWRPAADVRSVSEVYLHIAFANYLTIALSGGEVPKETGFVADFGKIKEWDSQTADKAKIKQIVEASFEALKKRISGLTDAELDRQMEAFGMTLSVRNFILTMISHTHEHLGQSIAYARMNGVTPPWNQG